MDEFEERSRALFGASVDGIDFATRSRLTRARHAALEAAGAGRRHWLMRLARWTPAVGMACAVLVTALWVGPMSHHGATVADNQSSLEDLELVAATDESAGDAMEMMQDDIEFYDWAEKASNAEPSA